MFTVYSLFSALTQKYYVGQTQDLDNRLMEHNSGETKSLRNGIPWSVVYTFRVSPKENSEALMRSF
jgi:putative endonuclease